MNDKQLEINDKEIAIIQGLIDINALLQSSVAGLTNAVQMLKERVEALERANSNLANAVTHE